MHVCVRARAAAAAGVEVAVVVVVGCLHKLASCVFDAFPLPRSWPTVVPGAARPGPRRGGVKVPPALHGHAVVAGAVVAVDELGVLAACNEKSR